MSNTLYQIGDNFYNCKYVKSIECNGIDCIMTMQNTEMTNCLGSYRNDKQIQFKRNNLQIITNPSNLVSHLSPSNKVDFGYRLE